MSNCMLTHGTSIVCFGEKKILGKILKEEKDKLKKRKMEIIAYNRGKKLIYVNKEKENCIWEIKRC